MHFSPVLPHPTWEVSEEICKMITDFKCSPEFMSVYLAPQVNIMEVYLGSNPKANAYFSTSNYASPFTLQF